MGGLQEWPPCIPGPRPQATRQKLYQPRRDRRLQAWRLGSDRASASNMTFQAILCNSLIQKPGLFQGFAWQSWHPDMPVLKLFKAWVWFSIETPSRVLWRPTRSSKQTNMAAFARGVVRSLARAFSCLERQRRIQEQEFFRCCCFH